MPAHPAAGRAFSFGCDFGPSYLSRPAVAVILLRWQAKPSVAAAKPKGLPNVAAALVRVLAEGSGTTGLLTTSALVTVASPRPSFLDPVVVAAPPSSALTTRA